MRTHFFLAGVTAGLAGLVLAACSTSTDAPAPSERLAAVKADGAGTIVAGISTGVQDRLAGAPLDAEGIRRAVSLGTESGHEVVLSPAIPAVGEGFTLLVLGPTESASARVTRNAWANWMEVAGTPFEGGVAFEIDHIYEAEMELAIQLQGGDIWLNNRGDNYRVAASPERELEWVGAQGVSQGGVPRFLTGGAAVWAGHGTEIAVQTWPLAPKTDVVLRWTNDGYETIHEVPMDVASISAGPWSNNAQWAAEIPPQAQGTQLIWWVEASAGGTTVWDSQEGSNYQAAVAAPPQPTWAAAGRFAFTKCFDWTQGCQAGWFWFEGLPPVMGLSPGSYQAYASAPFPAIEVYIPGITDATHGAGLQRAVDSGLIVAQVWSPLFGDAEGWGARNLGFVEKAGNNLRLSWQGRHTHTGAPTLPPFQALCVEDGQYPYVFRVSTDGGETFSWLSAGGALDAGGDDFVIDWQSNQPDWSPSFGAVPAPNGGVWDVSAGLLEVELVNTSNEVYTVESVTLDDPSGAFFLGVKGCEDAACAISLAPGERLELELSHVGEAADATLTVEVTSDSRCGAPTWSAALSAAPANE